MLIIYPGSFLHIDPSFTKMLLSCNVETTGASTAKEIYLKNGVEIGYGNMDCRVSKGGKQN